MATRRGSPAKARDAAERAATLLRAPNLIAIMTTRTLSTGRGFRAETYAVPLNVVQAAYCRDALSKAIYAKLFDVL
eukprot:6452623-Prymnesium_polylepis.1